MAEEDVRAAKVAKLDLVPVGWDTAKGFCRLWHRHHPKPPPGYLWAHGVGTSDGVLVGVAIVGRPVARHFDDGQTVEVNRSVTDGYPNANSMLYGAVARAACSMRAARNGGVSGASTSCTPFVRTSLTEFVHH